MKLLHSIDYKPGLYLTPSHLQRAALKICRADVASALACGLSSPPYPRAPNPCAYQPRSTRARTPLGHSTWSAVATRAAYMQAQKGQRVRLTSARPALRATSCSCFWRSAPGPDGNRRTARRSSGEANSCTRSVTSAAPRVRSTSPRNGTWLRSRGRIGQSRWFRCPALTTTTARASTPGRTPGPSPFPGCRCRRG